MGNGLRLSVDCEVVLGNCQRLTERREIMHPILADIGSAVTSALTDGATNASAYLVLAIAIPVAFFTFKLGKRALGRA